MIILHYNNQSYPYHFITRIPYINLYSNLDSNPFAKLYTTRIISIYNFKAYTIISFNIENEMTDRVKDTDGCHSSSNYG